MRDIAPKQRYDRFPSVGDHIHATPSFEHFWATPKHTIIVVCSKSKEKYRFLRVHGNLNCII